MEEKSEDIQGASLDGGILPVIPLRGFVMFPGMILNFELIKEKSITAARDAIKADQKILIVAQKDTKNGTPSESDLYKMGVIAEIKQIIHQQNGSFVRIVAEGISRARVTEYIFDSYVKAAVEVCRSVEPENTPEVTALVREAKGLFGEYLELGSKLPPDILIGSRAIEAPGELADYISSNVPFGIKDKQELLEELDSRKRIEHLLTLLVEETNIAEIQDKIGAKLKENLDKGQQDYILREQMRLILQELGEDDAPALEALKYKEKLKKNRVPEEVFNKLSKECDRFAKIPPGTSESNVIRTYVETCLALPWNKKTRDNIDLNNVKKVLDKQHFGLKDIKERVIEMLAVRKLSKGAKGQILCLEGPPGVGKTSIARSIADAMGRKYQRVSLGGIKDESEIRGHRRTYIGAMPGRIISAIEQSGVRNPVILLDEIDKLSNDYHGDPSAALLEVLDPEQNSTFYDHYIDFSFDLSEVLFITTANNRANIPKPLYDRMEILSLYSYTHQEKFNIAKKHLVSKLLKKNGLKKKEFSIDDGAIHLLIESYTREAGVRGLEKKLSSLMRKAAREIVSGEAESVNVDTSLVRKMLGPEKYKNHARYKVSEIGVVKGLAWTEVGGEVMPIEVALMKGKGKVQITGSLGDVMKESAQIAVSYIRSNADKLNIKHDFYDKFDIHIHAPEGAVPKDGPSAGVTMTTAIVSALSGTPIKQDVAMTGEITLKGKVLAIGGLKEKTMAAYRDGVKTIIIPCENESDLEEIDEEVKKSVNFVMAENLDTVFEHALDNKEKSRLESRKIKLVADGILSSALC